MLKYNNGCEFNVVEEVCPICYKFLQSIYDKKKMKSVTKIVDYKQTTARNNIKECKSLYHKKLTDGFKSSF